MLLYTTCSVKVLRIFEVEGIKCMVWGIAGAALGWCCVSLLALLPQHF